MSTEANIVTGHPASQIQKKSAQNSDGPATVPEIRVFGFGVMGFTQVEQGFFSFSHKF